MLRLARMANSGGRMLLRHFNTVTRGEATERPVDRLARLLPEFDNHGKGAALYFEKPSLRTRHSAEMAIVQLGGHPITVRPDEIGAGARETLSDIAKVLSGYTPSWGHGSFTMPTCTPSLRPTRC